MYGSWSLAALEASLGRGDGETPAEINRSLTDIEASDVKIGHRSAGVWVAHIVPNVGPEDL
jgi:hypothetical protein